MDINLLVNLTSRAWALDILAHLHAGVPGRQAPLIAATGAGRTAFRASLDHLFDLQLLARNPGHGHPLRPEFRLTPLGQHVAAVACQVVTLSKALEDQTVLRRRWSLPVLSLTGQPQRFSTLRRGLGRITDRALSQTLITLEDHGWMDRQVLGAARPVRATYHASGTGLLISQAVTANQAFSFPS